jgi:hypothetical protein
MRALVAVVVVAAAATSARGQDHQGCPMMKKADHRQAEVDHRHQDTTGVPREATEHHFVLSKDGGSIHLGVTGEGQAAARDSVRTHLQAIARSFTEGDFSMPMRIHDQVPPGVEVMKERRSSIRYVYSESPRGGVVTLTTTDPQTLAAVHEFLRFQIRDHATGDPTE